MFENFKVNGHSINDLTLKDTPNGPILMVIFSKAKEEENKGVRVRVPFDSLSWEFNPTIKGKKIR